MLILLVNQNLAFQISEINYNPIGNDNNQEYIEFQVNESYNYSLIIFGDNESNDTINLIKDSNNSEVFWLFVEEGFNISQINSSNCNIFSLGTTIGNNLDNSHDQIKIWYNNSLITNLSYNASGCSNGEGCSLSWNNTWINTNLTPCKKNIFPANESLIITNSSTNSTINKSPCEFNLSIWSDKNIINSGERIKYKPIISCNQNHELILNYWWTEANGNEFKKITTTTNTNEKSYTPKISVEEKTLIINMEAILSCSNISKFATKLIGVINGPKKNSQSSKSSSSSGSSTSITSKKEIVPEILSAEIPKKITQNKSFFINITLYNDGYLDQLFWVWAYLYKHSKTYSGTRDANMQEILIAPRTKETIKLKINNFAPDGDVKLKIKAVKEGRKTPYELTETLFIKKLIIRNSTQISENITQKITQRYNKTNKSIQNKITSNTVVENKSFIKSSWGPIILAGLLWIFSSIKKHK